MKKSEIKTYIVGICSSEANSVNLSRVIGTEKMVKHYIAKLVRDDISDYETNFAEGTTDANDVTVDESGVLNGYLHFSDYHITYTASPEKEPINLCNISTLTKISEDIVRITCYGKTKVMSRNDAIRLYSVAAASCDPGSSECGRYKNILCGLYEGKKEVSDED